MNFKGSYYLTLKEVKRFLTVWKQTLLAPTINGLLFLFVFTVAFKSTNNINLPASISFINFLLPGLIMMQVAQNSFTATSTTIMMSKMFGTMSDLYTAPLSSNGIAIAYIGAAVVRSFFIAIIIFIVGFIYSILFTNSVIHVAYPLLSLYFLLMASVIMAGVGLICGLWAQNFDKIAGISTLIIVPLTFLSGTFYSISKLPSSFHYIILANPVFHMMDGFRYSFIGVSDFNIILDMLILLLVAVLIYIVCYFLIKTGYKSKS